ncbi:restriction endonuclease subunit S [Myroides sp. 1354]|uniref:restriction endonuclease subunit S n=1 Tax=unclassified Myroides TaxID=2642485 RepID=UPI0025764EF1|nr:MULTISPECIES: restriction endonuclease subunit S [unclassified Myroides]MDM1056018.1 restriction endonuclease subunit S [Myroides sp. 1354]MDM1069033.1 restriction endonuclease subunit S [Myroides sp. 1372]
MTKIQKDNKNVAKFPNLRFPEFTEEWETKKLGEIGEIVNGLTYSPNDIAENGVLVLRSSNVQNRSLAFDDNVYVRTDNYNPVQENDILICVRNGSKNLIGKNALINKENEGVAFGAFMSIYRSSFNTFLFHWFDTNEYKEIVYKNLGATINSINGSDLRKFKVPFPSIEEQKKLASFLSIVDERIQTQNKIIEELKLLKITISKKLFSRQLRFKNGNNENYIDWNTKKLGEVTTLVNKRNKNNEKLPVYSINNKLGFVPQSEQFEGVDSEDRGYDIKLYKIINKNTFAYNPARINVGSIGYSENLENIIISSLYVCFKTDNTVNDNFLYQYLKTDFFNREVLRNVEGGVRDYLFYDNFARIKFDLPCIEEQKKIADYLSSIDSKIDIESQLLHKFEKQKRYLLANLFI